MGGGGGKRLGTGTSGGCSAPRGPGSGGRSELGAWERGAARCAHVCVGVCGGVCVCVRARRAGKCFVAWGDVCEPGSVDICLKKSGLGRGKVVGLGDRLVAIAEALVKTLSSYEVVTPARVNEFGEVFPQNHHFSRRKRSSEALEPAPFRTHYRISAYGQLFQLNLSSDAAFLAPGYTEVHLGTPAGGAEELGGPPPDLRHCFYRGQVNAREEHTAVFSLCGGLVSPLPPNPLAFCWDSGKSRFLTWWLLT